MKKIDLSNIPQKNNHYDWKNSIGCTCNFEHTNIKGTLKIIDYRSNGKNSELKIAFNDIEVWIDSTKLRTGGIGGKLKIFTSDYQYQINQILHLKTDLLILKREKKQIDNRQRKIYTYKCLQCGEINTTTEAILRKGSGCPYCANKKVKIGINDIPTTDPWMIPYFKDQQEASKYTKGSTAEIFPYCPVCRKQQTKSKKIYQIYSSHHSGCSCDTYMSFPEQVIFNLLLQNNINFIHRATKKELVWAENYEYDFYIPSFNIIIEAHGLQHYDTHGFSTLGGKSLVEEQNNDKIKQDLANQNHINYFVIDCRKSKLDFILNNIFSSDLKDILNLKIINKNALYDNILIYKKNKLKQFLAEKEKYQKNQLQKELQISSSTLNKLIEMIEKEAD